MRVPGVLRSRPRASLPQDDNQRRRQRLADEGWLRRHPRSFAGTWQGDVWLCAQDDKLRENDKGKGPPQHATPAGFQPAATKATAKDEGDGERRGVEKRSRKVAGGGRGTAKRIPVGHRSLATRKASKPTMAGGCRGVQDGQVRTCSRRPAGSKGRSGGGAAKYLVLPRKVTTFADQEVSTRLRIGV